MFSYFSSLALVVFEVICCEIFFESFCENFKEQRKWKRVILLIVLIVADYVWSFALSPWFIIKEIEVIAVTTLVMYSYFEISIKKVTVLAMLYQGLVLIIDYVVYAGNRAIFTKEGEVQCAYALEGNLIIVFGKIALFLCVLLIKKQFGKKTMEMLADTEWTRFLFFPSFTIITIAAMIMTFPYTENQTQENVLYTIAFGMVGMNVFVYALINDIVEREAKLHEKEMLELQVKNQIEMYHSISENFEIQKRKSHEFKNQILCIEALVKEQEYDELGKYVSRISENFINEKNVINTNHVIINAIVNAKYQEAISKGIVFVFRGNDLSKIKMQDEDLVVLLSNLLNNAIEACEKCQNSKTIKLKFVIDENEVILSVKNTYNHPIVYENNEIKTTKVIRPDEHGVGIKNIIRIVKKYKGSYVIQNSDNEFCFSMLFDI